MRKLAALFALAVLMSAGAPAADLAYAGTNYCVGCDEENDCLSKDGFFKGCVSYYDRYGNKRCKDFNLCIDIPM